MDMTLVTIDSKDKSDEITDLLRKTFTNINPAWTGGVAIGDDRHFVWVSDAANAQFTNWSPGEPSFSDNNEYCLLTGWKSNLQWNDANCHSKFGIICEYSQHYHVQKEMHDKLQEHLVKEQQLQTELDKNELLLRLLLDYKLSHKDNGANNSERKIFLNIN